jgi:hypothetical protein
LVISRRAPFRPFAPVLRGEGWCEGLFFDFFKLISKTAPLTPHADAGLMKTSGIISSAIGFASFSILRVLRAFAVDRILIYSRRAGTKDAKNIGAGATDFG